MTDKQRILERVSKGYKSDLSGDELREEFEDDFDEFRELLQQGEIRAAEKNEDGEWEAVPEVKRGLLLAFQLGELDPFPGSHMVFEDKHTLPPQKEVEARTVPGGTSIRGGAYIGDIIIMPPAYVNIGAYVEDDSMVDSHALVGSAAQVEEDVHLSAGAVLGGVLEPINQAPTIVESGAMIGTNASITEGVIVRENAVVAAGLNISGSTDIYDTVNDEVVRGEVPENAVVIPGSVEYAEVNGDQVNKDVAVIAKYRDESTDASTALEDALR